MEHSAITDKYNEQLLFKFSMIGIGLNADLLYTSRIVENKNDVRDIHNLKDGDSVFMYIGENSPNLQEVVSILQSKNIKVNFYICVEPLLSVDNLNMLLSVAHGIYCQNNSYNHPQIHCMPLGIRDCERVVPNHRGFSHQYLYDEGLKQVDKSILCLLCFTYTHQERYRCYGLLRHNDWVVNLNDGNYEQQPSIHCGKVPVWVNYEYTHKSKYVLCPRGCGEDTHRFYEAIYLDSIPIVKRTNTVFDRVYNVFPCLVVTDWNDITKEFLEDNLEECLAKLRAFKSAYPDIYTNVNTLKEIMTKL